MTAEEIASELAMIIAERDYALQLEDETLRARHCRELLANSLVFIATVLGDEILSDAYGRPDETDRSNILGVVAMRTNMLSHLFLRMPDDVADLNHVTKEALAIMRGDTPQLFERLPVRKSKYRVHEEKLTALRWDAWLDGMSVKPGARHDAIADAYSETWDVIDDWRGPIVRLFGRERYEEHLRSEFRDGSRSLRRLSMRPDEIWNDALKRDGAAYRQALRANA